MLAEMTEAPAGLPRGLSGFFAGIAAVLRGAMQLLRDAELRRLALVPVLLTGLFYLAVLTGAVVWADDLLGIIWKRPQDGFLHYLWLVLIPFAMLGVIAPFALLFASISEGIGGPFYEKMASRILSARTIAIREPSLVRGALADLARSLVFLAAGLPFALLAFIPGVGIAFAMVGWLIASLGFASSSINAALRVTGVGARGRIKFALSSFLAMVGIGAVISLSLLVPFLGLLSIPAGVVGATELYATSILRVQALSTRR